MIIEFNGIPGSGKTTYLEFFRRKMSEGGIAVQDNQEIMRVMKNSITPNLRVPVADDSHRRSKRIQIIRSLLECVSYNKELSNIYRFLLLGLKLRSSSHYLARAIELWTLYEFFQRNFRDGAVLLVDHGILQNIISFSHLRDLPRCLIWWENSLPHLLASTHTMVIVNCHASVADAMERVRTRASQHGRITRLPDKLMAAALLDQSRNFDLLRTMVSRLTAVKVYEVGNAEDIDQVLADLN